MEPRNKEPESVTYNLVQADKTQTGRSIALLDFRVGKLQMVDWKGWFTDIIDYAIESKLIDEETALLLAKLNDGQLTIENTALFLEKLKEVWDKMFKGVQRLATVQYLEPNLLFERISAELTL